MYIERARRRCVYAETRTQGALPARAVEGAGAPGQLRQGVIEHGPRAARTLQPEQWRRDGHAV